MKCFFSVIVFTLWLFSGCAIENFKPESVRPGSPPSQPVINAKPSKQQREAIMSGGKPDWSEVTIPGRSRPLKK